MTRPVVIGLWLLLALCLGVWAYNYPPYLKVCSQPTVESGGCVCNRLDEITGNMTHYACSCGPEEELK